MLFSRDQIIKNLNDKIASGAKNYDKYAASDLPHPSGYDGMDFDEMKNKLIYTLQLNAGLERELKFAQRAAETHAKELEKIE